jgi:hypothetical protein
VNWSETLFSSVRGTPLVLSMWPCKGQIDDAKSKHAGLVQQNGFDLAFVHSLPGDCCCECASSCRSLSSLKSLISTTCVVAPCFVATLTLLLKIPIHSLSNTSLVDSSNSFTYLTTTSIPYINLFPPHIQMTMLMSRVKSLSMAQCYKLILSPIFLTLFVLPIASQKFLPCIILSSFAHVLQFFMLLLFFVILCNFSSALFSFMPHAIFFQNIFLFHFFFLVDNY